MYGSWGLSYRESSRTQRQALAEALEGKSHHPRFSGRRARWPVKGCASGRWLTCSPRSPRSSPGSPGVQGHQEEEDEEEVAGEGHGSLHSYHTAAAVAAVGAGTEWSVFIASVPPRGSVTSQPCSDVTAPL